jgi:ABC-type amino acid transport substrate-binding protein
LAKEPINFITYNDSELVEDLNKRKFDIAIGSIYVTPDMLLKISFTDSYFSEKRAF